MATPFIEQDTFIPEAHRSVVTSVRRTVVAALAFTALLAGFTGDDDRLPTPLEEDGSVSFFYPAAAKVSLAAFQVENDIPVLYVVSDENEIGPPKPIVAQFVSRAPFLYLVPDDDPSFLYGMNDENELVLAAPTVRLLAFPDALLIEDDLPIAAVIPPVSDDDDTVPLVLTQPFARVLPSLLIEEDFVTVGSVLEDDVPFAFFISPFALPVAALLHEDSLPVAPQIFCVTEDPDWTYQQYPPTAMQKARVFWQIDDTVMVPQGAPAPFVWDDDFYCNHVAAPWYSFIPGPLDDGIGFGPRVSIGLTVNNISGVRYVVLSSGAVRYVFGSTSGIRYSILSTSAPRYKVDNTSAPRYTVQAIT